MTSPSELTAEQLAEALQRNGDERRALVREYNHRHNNGGRMPASHFTDWAPDNLTHHLAFDHDAKPDDLSAARNACYVDKDADALPRLHRQVHGGES